MNKKEILLLSLGAEILTLFDEAIGVNDTIWHTTKETLYDAIMFKIEEIL